MTVAVVLGVCVFVGVFVGVGVLVNLGVFVIVGVFVGVGVNVGVVVVVEALDFFQRKPAFELTADKDAPCEVASPGNEVHGWLSVWLKLGEHVS